MMDITKILLGFGPEEMILVFEGVAVVTSTLIC